MSDRTATVRLGADDTALDRALGRSKNKLSRWASGVKRDLTPVLRGAFEGLGTIAGFGGVAGIAAAGRNVFAFEKSLMRLGIQAGPKGTARDMATLRKEIYAAASAKGVDPDALLAGMTEFVSFTGDIGEARKQLQTFAMVAGATGSEVTEIARTGGTLFKSMDIAGDAMEKAFNILLHQGKAGAFELKDMATQLPSLVTGFRRFGHTGTEGLAEMGAMLQLVRLGFGSSSEAATGFDALMNSMIKRGPQLRAYGVDTTKGMAEQVFQLDKLLGKETSPTARREKLMHLLGGRGESATAFDAIAGVAGKGATDFRVYRDEALGANDAIKDHAVYLESAAGAAEKLKAQFKETFSNVIAGNLKGIVNSFQILLTVVKYLAEHPVLALAGYGALKFGGGGGLVGRLGGGGSGGGGLVGGVQRVFVTNMPGGIPGVPGTSPGAPGTPGGPRSYGAGNIVAAVPAYAIGVEETNNEQYAPTVEGFLGSVSGGMSIAGPLGALVGAAGYAGTKLGGLVHLALGGLKSYEWASGGSSKGGRADHLKYDMGDVAYSEDGELRRLYPGLTLAEARARAKEQRYNAEYGYGHDFGAAAPGSAAEHHGVMAGTLSEFQWGELQRALIDVKVSAQVLADAMKQKAQESVAEEVVAALRLIVRRGPM